MRNILKLLPRAVLAAALALSAPLALTACDQQGQQQGGGGGGTGGGGGGTTGGGAR